MAVLGLVPDLVAMHLRFVFLSTETGLVVAGVAAVGVEPSVVQRITAPGSLVTATRCADVNVPGAGLNTGAFGPAHDVSGVQGIGHGWHTGWNAGGTGGPLAGFGGVVAQAVMANSARSNALIEISYSGMAAATIIREVLKRQFLISNGRSVAFNHNRKTQKGRSKRL